MRREWWCTEQRHYQRVAILTWLAALGALTALGCVGALRAQGREGAGKSIVFTNVTVVDTNGGTTRADRTVVIQGNRILQVASSAPSVGARLPLLPKLNGAVERAQGTHTEEFYEVTPCSWHIPALSRELLAWESTYNTVRPHQALGYQTPHEFVNHWKAQNQKVSLLMRASAQA
jgi:hypothetical protein